MAILGWKFSLFSRCCCYFTFLPLRQSTTLTGWYGLGQQQGFFFSVILTATEELWRIWRVSSKGGGGVWFTSMQVDVDIQPPEQTTSDLSSHVANPKLSGNIIRVTRRVSLPLPVATVWIWKCPGADGMENWWVSISEVASQSVILLAWCHWCCS